MYYQAWLPAGAPKAVLVVAHGLGSHSGRYGNIVHYLVPRGIAVYGFDQIGHGKSEGARGMVERFGDFTETLTIYTGMVKGWQAGKPCFLFGHSAGGLIAVCQLLEHQADFRGAVISAPALTIPEGVTPAVLIAGRLLSIFAPRAGLLKLDPALLSHDPAVISAYRRDPLVFHGRTPARLTAELVNAMRRAAAEMHTITLPFLTFVGGEEKIVHPAGARMLYETAGSADKTIEVYDGLYHETFNEPERERVLEDMERWLEAHM
ncbi:MAG: lysophospholipase [Anaerolineales bacterium]|nr:lysophospholipase [Anaerolineales bacterium]